MFGWRGFKYRTEVIVNIHSILIFVPRLKELLKTFPNLRRASGEYRKAGVSELEAAAYLSLVVLESVLLLVPKDDIALTLQQLAQLKSNRFRRFRDQAAAKNGNGLSEMLPLTFALGFAFWYLGNAVRENKFQEMAYQTFVRDVVGMLQVKSPEERQISSAEHRLGPSVR
jgi:hypothetical protein